MEVSERPIESAIIKSIIDKRLVHAPQEAKSLFPAVLKQKPVSWASITVPQYFMVVFLTAEDQDRVNTFKAKRLNPFPGLITTEPEPAVFSVKEARNVTIRSNTVTNSFALYLGPDSTVLLEDHSQSVKPRDSGQISYKIPLAYLLSYGKEINTATLYEYFDGLVAYSTNLWREGHD